MSFMTISFKKATNKTSIKHNNRKFDEKDWENEYHKHIDQTRTVDNRYLIQRDIHEMYDEIFGEALEKYNAKQSRKCRQIKDYYQHVKKSKTLELQREFIVQVGNVEDFQVEENWQKANAILTKYVETFEERNPNFRVYNAVIHNDEASPHLHINVIPVATGYKRGMSVQPSFDKAIRQQGIESKAKDSRDVFRTFRNREIDAVAELAKELNIERKMGETNKFKDTREYKQYQQGLQELKADISEKTQEAHEIKKQVQNLNIFRTHLESRTGDLKQEVDKYTEDISKLNTEQNRVQKSISEQKRESETLEKKISVEKNRLKSVSNQVDDINHRIAVAWHDDWLTTKEDFPDFSMKTRVSQKFKMEYGETDKDTQEFEQEIEVDENTPKEQGFDFRRTLNLFNEKVKGFTDYLKDKALELERKAKELLEREQTLDERENELANQLELNVSLLQDIHNMDSDLREVRENQLLGNSVMEIAKSPRYSTNGKLDESALENLNMSEVSPFDDGRLDADKFYKVHRNAIERGIDEIEKTLDVDIRKDVPKEEYKRVVSNVAVSMYANELLKGIQMLPKHLKRDEDMERAKIDYNRLEREIERSNQQQAQTFDFDFS